MKDIVTFINESNNCKNKLYDLRDKYCDDYGNSDTMGGAIIGGLCYLLNRWNNDGDTCEDNDTVLRINKYIINDINIPKYKDLSQVSHNNYEKVLYENIETVLNFLDKNSDLYKKPNNGYFTIR